MINWIRKLLGLCEHKWKIIRETSVNVHDDWNNLTDRFTRYHLQCEKCGDVKSKDMK